MYQRMHEVNDSHGDIIAGDKMRRTTIPMCALPGYNKWLFATFQQLSKYYFEKDHAALVRYAPFIRLL